MYLFPTRWDTLSSCSYQHQSWLISTVVSVFKIGTDTDFFFFFFLSEKGQESVAQIGTFLVESKSVSALLP